MPTLRHALRLSFGAVLVLVSSPHSTQGQSKPPDRADLVGHLEWRGIGPANMSGRVTDIEAVEADFATVYVAAASGGVFKSTNAGTTWEPIFDRYGSASTSMRSGSIPPAPTATTSATTRVLTSRSTAAINRYYWNLRFDPTEAQRKQTEERRRQRKALAPAGGEEGGGPSDDAPAFATPGSYLVKLSVKGKSLAAPLAVREDPGLQPPR